jgi:hypothetical protein
MTGFIIPVICKFCQAGKQFSAIISVICKVCQAGKRFSVITPVITAYLSDKLCK